MDSSEEKESFSFLFLKPKHLGKVQKEHNETKFTPKEICKKLQEKNIDPDLFDIIENVILVLIDFL